MKEEKSQYSLNNSELTGLAEKVESWNPLPCRGDNSLYMGRVKDSEFLVWIGRNHYKSFMYVTAEGFSNYVGLRYFHWVETFIEKAEKQEKARIGQQDEREILGDLVEKARKISRGYNIK